MIVKGDFRIRQALSAKIFNAMSTQLYGVSPKLNPDLTT